MWRHAVEWLRTIRTGSFFERTRPPSSVDEAEVLGPDSGDCWGGACGGLYTLIGDIPEPVDHTCLAIDRPPSSVHGIYVLRQASRDF
jgi:hypothetical protein